MKNFENIRKKHIYNGSELSRVSQITPMPTLIAKNGFESLKAYDTNNDNIIDNGEPIKLSDKVKSTNLNLLVAWILNSNNSKFKFVNLNQ